MRGLPIEETQDGVSPLADVEKLVVEGRYGRADLALRRLEALIPSLAPAADAQTLLLALYGRALLLRQGGATPQISLAACDVLERAAHEREAELWVATACATRARFRVDSGDIGGATADLARADAEAEAGDLTSDTGYRLLDALALVYAGLRLHDRADEVRDRIEHSIKNRRVLDQAQHWATWSGELAARAMEPLAGGAPDPEHELMGRAIEIAARLDGLAEADVPSTLRRGARGVRALSAAYRGRPSEALRLLGPDAFGTVGDLPLVERQIVSLAAMRAHALVGSLATARSLDDAQTGTPATLPNLVLEVCRTRERLWLETYAGGDVIPVLHRMTELLVRLGWRGMDLVADTARQALEHQALRTESRTDALTGVGNRRALDEELRQLLRFGPLPLALILVDIDHFKGVNDVYTHVVGDEVLRRVAASLSLQLRTDDQLLRYGGDEFVVLLPGTGDEEADAVAGRMRAAVADRPWSELADGLSVSVTTGVAAVWSLSGRRPDADAEKLFRRADERLLEGKRSRPEESRSHNRESGPNLPNLPLPAASDITVVLGAEKTGREDAPDRTNTTGRTNTNGITIPAAALSAAELLDDGDRGPATGGLPVTRRPFGNSLIGPNRLTPPNGFTRPSGLTPPNGFTRPSGLTPPNGFTRPSGLTPPNGFTRPAGLDPRAGSTPPAGLTRPPQDALLDPEDDLDEDEPLGPAPAARPYPGSTPARPRSAGRASTGSPDRPYRSAFDPDPDLDLDDEDAIEPAPRPSGRRDARPRTSDSPGEGRRHGLNAPAPMRSRREARAAGRPDLDALHETSAGRDAAEADAAAREVAQAQADEARQRAAREARARDDAARDAEVRARAEHEKAAREAESRDRAAREKTAREAVAREKALREAAARERVAAEAAREAAEAEARAKAAREKAEREQAAREAAEATAREAAEAAAREAEERAETERRRLAERARVERERREAEAREQELREAKARADHARREAEAREQERREAAAAREKAAQEQAAREKAAEEKAAREAAEAAAARKAAEEREAAEAERRRAAERARVEAERRRAEAERREAEAREAERRAAEAKAEQERRDAEARAEQERRDAEARARAEREQLQRQRAEQERQAREQRERERREAEAREAEQLRQQARARAEAEARAAAIERARIRAEAEAERARAADRIREEAYARAAEQARRAAGGSYPGRVPGLEPAALETGPLSQVPPANPHPLQRRAPLYDASRQSEETGIEPFRERRSHPRPGSSSGADQASPLQHQFPGSGTNGSGTNGSGTNGSGTNGSGTNGSGRNSIEQMPDPESMETTAIRSRREPFGPVTRSQAIIDLSARKRPRSPYTG